MRQEPATISTTDGGMRMSRIAFSGLTAALLPGSNIWLMTMAAAMAIVLSGCGVVGRTSIETVQLAMQGKPDVKIVAADIAANRYPQIKVNGPLGGAVLVLGNIDNGRQAWYSADNGIVFLRDGLIESTHGGSPQLQRMWIEGENPFQDLLKVTRANVHRRYDVMPNYYFGVPVVGTLERIGAEQVTILGHNRELLHFREQLHGEGWKRDNHYWVDPNNGFIWKSIQAIAPDASLEIIQLKPYSPDLQRR